MLVVTFVSTSGYGKSPTCFSQDALAGEDAWFGLGFSRILLEWSSEAVGDACAYSPDDNEAYLCDEEQLFVFLANTLDADSMQAVGSTLDLNVLMLEPFPSPDKARLLAEHHKDEFSEDTLKKTIAVIDAIPHATAYFRAPGLYAMSIAFGDGGVSANPEQSVSVSVHVLASADVVFRELKHLSKNPLVKMSSEQRRSLVSLTPEKRPLKLADALDGNLLHISLPSNNKSPVISVSYTPVLPVALTVEALAATQLYYGVLDAAQQFVSHTEYGKEKENLVTWHALGGQGEQVRVTRLSDVLKQDYVDERCDGWIDARDIWTVRFLSISSALVGTVFLPEHTVLAFPCATRDAHVQLRVFDGREFKEHSLNLKQGRWFGAGNVVDTGTLVLDNPFEETLGMLKEGMLCLVVSEDGKDAWFAWNPDFFLHHTLRERSSLFVLEIPYDAERNVLEHEGLLVDFFGIGEQGSYLIKASIPQRVLPGTVSERVALTITPVKVHSRIKWYFGTSSPEDFIVECATSGTSSTSSQYTSVMLALNDPQSCDLKVRGRLYQRLNRVFEIKLYKVEDIESTNRLRLYLAFKPRLSSLLLKHMIPEYTAPFVSSVDELEELKAEFLEEPLIALSGSTVRSLYECEQQCVGTSECELAYCDSYTKRCVKHFLEGSYCNKKRGLCSQGSCVPLPSAGVDEKCKAVQCISSECTRRYADPGDGCKCKEVRLNGNECDGGKGICDNGVCKPKKSYFNAAHTFVVTLKAPYDRESATLKQGRSLKIDASTIKGQGVYELAILSQKLSFPFQQSHSISLHVSIRKVPSPLSLTLGISDAYLICYEKSKGLPANPLTVPANKLVAKLDVPYACTAVVPYNPSKRLHVMDVVLVNVFQENDVAKAKLMVSFPPLSLALTPPKVSDPCKDVTCPSDLSRCRLGSCYEGRCVYKSAPVGTKCGENSYCDAHGKCVKAEREPISKPVKENNFLLIYVPIEWKYEQELFKKIAERSASEFVEMAQLKTCKTKVRTYFLDKDVVKQRCKLSIWDCMSDKEATKLLKALENCTLNMLGVPVNGENYRVIGMTSAPLLTISIEKGPVAGCHKAEGYGDFESKAVLLSALPKGKESPDTTVHELGHTFRLCDQYSIIFYILEDNKLPGGCPNYYPGEIRDKRTGKVYPYRKCPYNIGKLVTNCPEINLTRSFVDCHGRKVPVDGLVRRDVMGHGGLPTPRPFDCFEVDVIKSKLKC
jgi:hypothetical protein